ncbi:TetR/AcrR family transcriptional regulator [Geobacter sp. AOG1]|uniref:TetR/AcrR family transcriptional regulator n=1 Tax=Geobacter sp. AOG1 TaxID=1566346 RepID=UPI001CC3CED1|nr:TetR/AcrR family transcriptional regulator [Geobacter sp. AOG1]GFE57320.1 TetR family transcriptional regulator [Geobacter sp. AOG1]
MGQQIKGERVDAAVRQRLLAAALDSFTRKGYAATSVREVVAAAGVTKPVLYYYFGSKEGIYLELMNDTYALFAKRLDLLAACQGSVRERLIAFCTGCFDGFVEHVQVVRLIYSIYFGPSQGAPPFPYEEPFDRMLAILAGFVRDGIAAGELVAVDEKDATWAIISCLNTVMEEQLCHTPPRIDRQGLVRILNLILNGFSQGVKP